MHASRLRKPAPLAEIRMLRRRLEELGSSSDDELVARYSLRWPRRPSGLYWQMRWLIAMVLRYLEHVRVWRPDPWPVVLKQGCPDADGKPLLIWAVGTERETVRSICERIGGLRRAMPEFAPVLVTDVADFAFFSRLGWLVEYLPRLTGEGEPYENRKKRLLARLYRGAPALPIHAIAAADWDVDDIRRWLRSSDRKRGR